MLDESPHEIPVRTGRYVAVKRAVDVAVAGAALLVLAPLILGLALLVRKRLGSPVLFRQPRPGMGGQVFTLLKFRTMADLCDESGEPLPDEMRLTKFGAWLRSTSLDELPELYNVVRGDMSLVGPRPLRVSYLDHYTPRQRRRHEVRPGVTGWAQVNGRNTVSWIKRFDMDVWYVEHMSPLLDLRILLRTISVLVAREGINPEGATEMPLFVGEVDAN